MSTLFRKVLALLVGVLIAPSGLLAATFYVTTSADSGPGSLRQAIIDANHAPGNDSIVFRFSYFTELTPISPLPDITDGVSIDATNKGSIRGLPKGAPSVRIKGSSDFGPGLRISGATGHAISGLVISGFESALHVYWASAVKIHNNHLLSNACHGIDMERSHAVAIRGNVISGNGCAGVWINGSYDITIQGNRIGVDVEGLTAMGNHYGVACDFRDTFSADILIGGATTDTRNIISGHSYGISTHFCYGTVAVYGNFIGTDLSGQAPIPNGIGISLGPDALHHVGGNNPGEGNLIAFNTTGINLYSHLHNETAIRGNSFHSNGIAIDRGWDGVTLNVFGDGNPDFPQILDAVATGSGVRVQGTASGRIGDQLWIDFYASPSCNPSGYGDGKTYLGAISIIIKSANTPFTAYFQADKRQYITATSTPFAGFSEGHGTSEFSRCVWMR